MRKLTFICALAILLGISTAAFAGVQNIRVSGNIDSYYYWSQYDTFYYDATARDESPDITFFATRVGLNFDADLTENVSGHIKLVNHRAWDLDDGDALAMDIGIAEAYVTLQNMLYEPLTITIGRQPLYYGRGFIIGSNVIDPEGQVGIYDELSLYDGFDAIKAELNYDPWTLDLVYSLISENDADSEDDVRLWLVNLGREFDAYNSELELYYVGLYDDNRTRIHIDRVINPAISPVQSYYTDANVPAYEQHTIGGRGSLSPIENATLYGEIAYQFGDIGDVSVNADNLITGVTTRDVSAWGAEVGGDYLFADVTGEPKIGLCYTFREGENFNGYGYAQGDYDAFYTPFMRRSDTVIFGHNGRYNIGNVAGTTGGVPSNLYYKNGDFVNSVDDDDTAWDTNMHQILVTGSIKPLAYWDINDVNLTAKYAWFQFEESPVSGADDDAGDELDILLTYDYTEDVQFGLTTAWFWPGDYYDRGQPNNQADAELVTQVVGSCKVTF